MRFDTMEASLLITVEKRGVCVFGWDGITKSEIEDALKVIQEFVASGKPNLFTKNGEGTGRRITVQLIHRKPTLSHGENHGQGATSYL